MQSAPAWVPISIAIGSVIIVPAAVWIGRKIAAAWHEHRVKLLGEVFVTREEVDRQFQLMNDTQARQHRENQQALEALRLDGKEREGKIAGILDSVRSEVRDEGKDMRAGIGKVHERVDSVLAMLGNRRKT